MIFVAGTMYIDSEHIAGFQNDVRAMIGKVRTEEGCHHYSILVEDAVTGLVQVLEQWTDDAALDAHMRQPWIVQFLQRNMVHLLASTVQVFDIAGVRPLPNIDL